jgi:heptosyltransferase-2
LNKAGYQILLIGGDEDRDLCRRIRSEIGQGCLNLAGQTTLRQSAEVLKYCDLLVTNDSAPTHLGSAAGTRVLTLFGSTAPDFGFAPYGPKGRSLGIELDCRPCTNHGRRHCPEKHFRCMLDLTPDRVFSAASDMIKGMPLSAFSG